MTLTVNGESRESSAAVVDQLLDELGVERRAGIAIALNGEVLRRSEWSTCALNVGDAIEIVGAVQGG